MIFCGWKILVVVTIVCHDRVLNLSGITNVTYNLSLKMRFGSSVKEWLLPFIKSCKRLVNDIQLYF